MFDPEKNFAMLCGLVVGALVALFFKWLFSGTDQAPIPVVSSEPDPEEESEEEVQLADLPDNPAFPAGNFWVEFQRDKSNQPWAIFSIQRIVADEDGPLFWCYSREDAIALAEKMSRFEHQRILADVGQVDAPKT